MMQRKRFIHVIRHLYMKFYKELSEQRRVIGHNVGIVIKGLITDDDDKA